ncbi:MAG TPA: coenzyme F420-0:L-glutamate ligase [Tissierellaceae bacterium]|nr:coenzyme F420-0:L-glutamate ligase [Tissierellaceae bacterium]
MSRTVGTIARGIRTPIVKEGDNLINIVVDSILLSSEKEGYELRDKDVVGITESLVARAQGNYVTTDVIARDIASKFPGEIGVVFPILSRNRFSILLRGIAKSNKKIHLLLNYPADEVGNHLMDIKKMHELKINPYSDVLTEEDYRDYFGEKVTHQFTGIDYVELYKQMAFGNIDIYFSNDPTTILNYTKDVLVANVHDRKETKETLKSAGANILLGLEDLLTSPIDNSGYNPEYGLLGSNLASDDEVKLFPKDNQYYVDEIQKKLIEKTGKTIEVMVYGDGAFRDPVGRIWELADPVVSPAYTDGLKGTPNEIKLKYIVDTELDELNKEEVLSAVKQKIYAKDVDLLGQAESLGTTPRQITDLLGSLCDLISGSGDKGTPVVLVQGYFDNFASD